MSTLFQKLFLELLNVVDLCYRDNGKFPEMRVDDDWLGIIVADHPDAVVASKLLKLILELCAEISVFDTVDAAAETMTFCIVSRHTCTARPKM